MGEVWLVLEMCRGYTKIRHAASTMELAYAWAREHEGTGQVHEDYPQRDGLPSMKIKGERYYQFRKLPIDSEYQPT